MIQQGANVPRGCDNCSLMYIFKNKSSIKTLNNYGCFPTSDGGEHVSHQPIHLVWSHCYVYLTAPLQRCGESHKGSRVFLVLVLLLALRHFPPCPVTFIGALGAMSLLVLHPPTSRSQE